MSHWFIAMQKQAQKDAESFVSTFSEFEREGTVNIASFASDLLTSNLGTNEDLRNRLLSQSKIAMDDFYESKNEQDLNKVKDVFAKLQVIDRVVDYQLTNEKIKTKQEQLTHLNRMAGGMGHPGFQQSLSELVQREKKQLNLLHEEADIKRSLISSTVEYYHENDKSAKNSIEHTVNTNRNNLNRIHHETKTNAQRFLNEFIGERFHSEALRMGERSRVLPEVERSAMKLAKLQDKQVEFARQYTFAKKQAESHLDHTSSKSKLEERFL